tara:strand:- start:197 stop:1021 length:825 start_codon:yes stop_codon:yes gene_type:complete
MDFKSFFSWPLNKLQSSNNPKLAVTASNFKFFLKRSQLNVSYDSKLDLYLIKDGSKIHYFGNLLRGLKFYNEGLLNRSKKLFNSYLLENIKFNDKDIVIDCGANYGDLWLSLEGKINPSSYITFEPGIKEYQSLILNAPDGTHNCLGLDNKNGRVQFFVNERFGDSSLVEPSNYSHLVEIETTTLSSYIESKDITKIKLLKLEAEGYEPEILEGANSIIHTIEYIAIDGGYERGINEEETFTSLNSFLLKSGFKMIARHETKHHKALYRNEVYK